MTATTARPTLPGVTAASFTQVIPLDRAVAALNPLHMDWFFWFGLPLINAIPMRFLAIRVWLLALAANRFSPSESQAFGMHPHEAMAATRDLGMIAASLRRCGEEPGFVPVLEAALLSLALVTGEVPSLSVWSYGGLRNPDDRRLRRFTFHRRERLFIRDIRTGMKLLPRAVDLIRAACDMSIYDDDYAGTLEEAAKCLNSMVTAIQASRRNISPEFFTYVMRPFFEPMRIGDKVYKSAGAAQMPLIWIDLLLWAMEGLRWPYADYGLNRWSYWDYFAENLEYQPQCLREQVEALVELESLLGRARRELALKGLNDVSIRSLAALHGILRVMVKFRAPHVIVAEKNMSLRPPGSVGSGGYQSSLLKFLLEVVTSGRDEVRSWLPAGTVRG